MLFALLLQAVTPPPPVLPPAGPGQPPATFVVEPVGMALAGFDADGDGRTTRAEMEAGVRRSYAAIDTGNSGSIGYIAFADWAERWLGDRNALPARSRWTAMATTGSRLRNCRRHSARCSQGSTRTRTAASAARNC